MLVSLIRFNRLQPFCCDFFCSGFENIYVGWGLKAVGPAFSVLHGSNAMMPEFTDISGALAEMADPTPTEEQEAQQKEEKENEEEEEDDDDGEIE